jgi:arsenite methyltransferase
VDQEKEKQLMKTIKEAVREKYAKAAKEAASCCEPSCCSSGSKLVEYEGVPGVVPESNLGLGCGVPTQYADLKTGETVVDLGSGAGIDVFLAAQEVGPTGRVIGIDMTPEMIQRARENAAKNHIQNVEFRQGDIEAIPVDDASVDVVLSNCVINLAPDKRRVYSEMHRVLRPGGRFVVSDMVTYGRVPASVRKDLELWAGCVAGALDRNEYLDVIAEAGFEGVIVKAESTYDSPEKASYGLQSVTLEGQKRG